MSGLEIASLVGVARAAIVGRREQRRSDGNR